MNTSTLTNQNDLDRQRHCEAALLAVINKHDLLPEIVAIANRGCAQDKLIAVDELEVCRLLLNLPPETALQMFNLDYDEEVAA